MTYILERREYYRVYAAEKTWKIKFSLTTASKVGGNFFSSKHRTEVRQTLIYARTLNL